LGDSLPLAAAGQSPFVMASAYLLVAAILWSWSVLQAQHISEER
jgi:hypothetical protein